MRKWFFLFFLCLFCARDAWADDAGFNVGKQGRDLANIVVRSLQDNTKISGKQIGEGKAKYALAGNKLLQEYAISLAPPSSGLVFYDYIIRVSPLDSTKKNYEMRAVINGNYRNNIGKIRGH